MDGSRPPTRVLTLVVATRDRRFAVRCASIEQSSSLAHQQHAQNTAVVPKFEKKAKPHAHQHPLVLSRDPYARLVRGTGHRAGPRCGAVDSAMVALSAAVLRRSCPTSPSRVSSVFGESEEKERSKEEEQEEKRTPACCVRDAGRRRRCCRRRGHGRWGVDARRGMAKHMYRSEKGKWLI